MKMYRFFSLSIVLLFCFILSAQTTISNDFSSNATLSAANSPYIIDRWITINHGVTVTVESGVEVKFNSGAGLRVRGALTANGATFTANGSVNKGFWTGIEVSRYNYEEASVTLNNCNIEFARNLYLNKGVLNIVGSTLSNFSEDGVRIYAPGTLNISNTTISDCNYPITFYGEGAMNLTGTITATNNTHNHVDLNFTEIHNSFHLKDIGLAYSTNDRIEVKSTGTLTIDPNITINLHRYGRINVFGKMNAVGTSDQPIHFVSDQSYYQSIYFGESAVDTECLLTHCIIKNNTSRSYYALSIESASPTIENCTFTGNRRNVLIEGKSVPTFKNCSFGASVLEDAKHCLNIVKKMDANPVFENNSIAFNETEIRAIGIVESDVTGDAHLQKAAFDGIDNISYCLYNTTHVNDTASLTIDGGIVIKAYNSYSKIDAEGKLTAIGSASEPIIFTALADDSYGNPADSENNATQDIANNSGLSISMRSIDKVSRLAHCKMFYGATHNSTGFPIEVYHNNIVEECEISTSDNGICFKHNASVTHNIFSEIVNYPIGRVVSNGTPTLQNNTLANVGNSGIYISSFENDNPTLAPLAFAGNTNTPYIINNQQKIDVSNTVTIAPETIIKFNESDYARLIVDGALIAEGAADKKIIFTSLDDDAAGGDTNNNATETIPAKNCWTGIHFSETSDDDKNMLKYCEIRYAGYRYWGGRYRAAIRVENCKVTIDNSIISFSNTGGIGIFGTANPDITNCRFQSLDDAPIYMDAFASPHFANNTLSNLKMIGIRLRGAPLSGVLQPRSFAGYDNITYLVDETITVEDDLTLSESLVFKGNGKWDIKGKLTVAGTKAFPVVFTTLNDDMYGNPFDTEQNGAKKTNQEGTYFVFYDNADDMGIITNGLFRYSKYSPIQLNNASPTIQHTVFEEFEKEAIALKGTSAPSIQNCTFNNITFPFSVSLTTYPSATAGNSILGTTGRAIRVADETLTQDATIKQREFAGISNIPYAFYRYTIGTGATLTIKPGIVSKFLNNGSLNVNSGLLASGKNELDSLIVFTSIDDDFYGGDTYEDGVNTSMSNTYWNGIRFWNEAIDGKCKLQHVIIKNAASNGYYDSSKSGAVRIKNASPRLENCRFENTYYGITLEELSLPVISNCDFIKTNGYAIWNKSTSSTVTASNCWFNHITGPTHSSNPDGEGERVSDNVTYTPFNTAIGISELGDVSENGSINPYDASLILQHNVSNITLSNKQQLLADVSGDGSISALDASKILQYNVELIGHFRSAAMGAAFRNASANNLATITFSEKIIPETATRFKVPVVMKTNAPVFSLDMKLKFDSRHLALKDILTNCLKKNISIAKNNKTDDGNIALSIASAYALDLNEDTIYLRFEIKDRNIEFSNVAFRSIIIDEQSSDNLGDIGVETRNINSMLRNEETNAPVISILENTLYVKMQHVHEDLLFTALDAYGRILRSRPLTVSSRNAGYWEIPLSEIGANLKGVYLIVIESNTARFTEKVLLK